MTGGIKKRVFCYATRPHPVIFPFIPKPVLRVKKVRNFSNVKKEAVMKNSTAVVLFVCVLLAGTASCQQAGESRRELIKKLAGNDCASSPDESELCAFVLMPEKLTSTLRVPSDTLPGEKLTIKNKIVDSKGNPAEGMIVYIYQTNTGGIYPKKGNEEGVHRWHGYLHAYGITGADGSFEIQTIKPGPYPSWTAPAHIHCILLDKNNNAYYINDYVFEGEPFVDERYGARERSPGSSGILKLTKNSDGSLSAERVIRVE